MVGLQVVAGFPIAPEVRKLSLAGKQLDEETYEVIDVGLDWLDDFIAAMLAADFDLRETKGVQVSDFNVQTNIF